MGMTRRGFIQGLASSLALLAFQIGGRRADAMVPDEPIATQWNVSWDDAAATPIADIRAAMKTIRDDTGQTPNWLCVTREFADHLEGHGVTIDGVKVFTYEPTEEE